MTWRIPALSLAVPAAGCCFGADKLIDAALADNGGYNRLACLCYGIGGRRGQ